MSIANGSLESALTAITLGKRKTAGVTLMSLPTVSMVVKAGLELFGNSEQLRIDCLFDAFSAYLGQPQLEGFSFF